jgi:hypothetical protein
VTSNAGELKGKVVIRARMKIPRRFIRDVPFRVECHISWIREISTTGMKNNISRLPGLSTK